MRRRLPNEVIKWKVAWAASAESHPRLQSTPPAVRRPAALSEDSSLASEWTTKKPHVSIITLILVFSPAREHSMSPFQLRLRAGALDDGGVDEMHGIWRIRRDGIKYGTQAPALNQRLIRSQIAMLRPTRSGGGSGKCD